MCDGNRDDVAVTGNDDSPHGSKTGGEFDDIAEAVGEGGDPVENGMRGGSTLSDKRDLTSSTVRLDTLSRLASWLERSQGRPLLGVTRVTTDTAFRFGNCGHIEFDRIGDDLFQIVKIRDKKEGYFDLWGKPSAHRIMGRYILFRRFLDMAQSLTSVGDELDDTDVFQRMLHDPGLLGVHLHGDVYDVGNPRGYATANLRITGGLLP